MQNYFSVLKENPLFESIIAEDFAAMLHCLGAFRKEYQKKEIILLAGDRVNHVGLVLSGAVKIVQQDLYANETVLAEIATGDTFGEVFACADISHSPVIVIAKEDCNILFLDYKKVITTCSKACVFHAKLSENLLKLIARKCLFLNKRLEILSKRTTQAKIMAFLLYAGNGQTQITLSLNREEMANFICVERSAMCAELSKMKKKGLIRYHKNQFELLKPSLKE
ncbi:MAG: Crp/Fnr family transcriptional regulator [Faecalibacterium sp.]